jgi:transitional endoplasmic reticulum ATPase
MIKLQLQGRFHHVIEVKPPNESERVQLLQYFGSKFGLQQHVIDCLNALTKDGMSGADIENLCREAGMNVIRRMLADARVDNEKNKNQNDKV